jgi:hypothetical protein
LIPLELAVHDGYQTSSDVRQGESHRFATTRTAPLPHNTVGELVFCCDWGIKRALNAMAPPQDLMIHHGTGRRKRLRFFKK